MCFVMLYTLNRCRKYVPLHLMMSYWKSKHVVAKEYITEIHMMVKLCL
jgi:hypothetical protein